MCFSAIQVLRRIIVQMDVKVAVMVLLGESPGSSSDAELDTSWNTSVVVLVLRGKDTDDRLGTELDCTLYLVFLLNRSHCSAWK